MTDDERLREMAQQQLAQAASHQVLGRVKKVQFHRGRADLFRRAAQAIRVKGMLVETLESALPMLRGLKIPGIAMSDPWGPPLDLIGRINRALAEAKKP